MIDSVVFYTIKDPFKATFEIENYRGAVESLVQATLRNECGNLSARELLAGRQKLADQLRSQLDKDTAPWGIAVRLVEITDIRMTTN
jgi:regulator of protease activity HflC (stomatin/prohibitin superfamily)